MKLALLLGNPEVLEHRRWRELSVHFFANHREDILAWCKYDNLVEKMPPVPVKNGDVLIDVFAGMKREGIFGTSSFMDLAVCMLSFFQIELRASSLRNQLEASDGYTFTKIWNEYWNKKNEKYGKK